MYISCVCFVSMDNAWQMVQQCVCEIYMYVCIHTDICVFFFTIFSLPLSLTNMHTQYIINNYGLYLVHIRLFTELSFQFFYMFKRRGRGGNPRRWGIPAVGCAEIVIFFSSIYFLLLSSSSSLVIEFWIYLEWQDAFLLSFESECGHVVMF